jgi:RNA polymerase sigma factor (sigma-70 family)
MPDITRVLEDVRAGTAGADELLPLVYDELRKLAAARLAHEKPGQTLDATALVHEAYLRLLGNPKTEIGNANHDSAKGSDFGLCPSDLPRFEGRGHFFAAAAEAMRRILVENARRKKAEKHGGGLNRHDAAEIPIAAPEPVEDLVALDEALDRFAAIDPQKAELVKLRYFAGLTIEEAAEALGISPATAKRHWTYSRAWLFQAIAGEEKPATDQHG